MRKSVLQLYAPFLALVLVQALVITAAPSTGPGDHDIAFDELEPEGVEQAPDGSADADWEMIEEETLASGPDGDGTFADPGGFDDPPSSAGGPGATPGTTAPDAPAEGRPEGPVGAAAGPTGDRSHCTEDGRQHGVVFHAPPCQPKWSEGADNGGATYRGVTADEITVVFFREQKNEHVATLLNQEGLARTVREEQEFLEASGEFLNKHYETYGRRINLVLHLAERCPETPPDIPACRWEAQHIIDKYDPFMVLWPVPLYPDVFDVFARNQVISIGGWHFDARYFNDRRPFRYDVFMDGTQTVDALSEYYCKKLANENASHSGRVIHATIGARGQVPRRLGIISPEGGAFDGPVARLVQAVDRCDSQQPVVARYQSDIERAQSQATANIQQMIEGNVTTVVCLCDPIAPIFRTLAMTQQRYYPENLLAGSGLLDYDKLGRLYEPSQWAHAFGPSHLGAAIPHAQSDATKVWRDVGRSGEPCLACNLPWAYYQLAGAAIQNAGPNLNPQTVERGLFAAGARGGWEQTGGRPDLVMSRFGQNDYTGVTDFREVYWNPAARSGIDGRAGAYVATHGGQRWVRGQIPSSFEVPAAAQ